MAETRSIIEISLAKIQQLNAKRAEALEYTQREMTRLTAQKNQAVKEALTETQLALCAALKESEQIAETLLIDTPAAVTEVEKFVNHSIDTVLHHDCLRLKQAAAASLQMTSRVFSSYNQESAALLAEISKHLGILNSQPLFHASRADGAVRSVMNNVMRVEIESFTTVSSQTESDIAAFIYFVGYLLSVGGTIEPLTEALRANHLMPDVRSKLSELVDINNDVFYSRLSGPGTSLAAMVEYEQARAKAQIAAEKIEHDKREIFGSYASEYDWQRVRQRAKQREEGDFALCKARILLSCLDANTVMTIIHLYVADSHFNEAASTYRYHLALLSAEQCQDVRVLLSRQLTRMMDSGVMRVTQVPGGSLWEATPQDLSPSANSPVSHVALVRPA